MAAVNEPSAVDLPSSASGAAIMPNGGIAAPPLLTAASTDSVNGSSSSAAPAKRTFADFTFGRHLGEGSYSSVVAAIDRHTGKEYAIKVLDKRHIIREKKVKYVNVEKDVFNRVHSCPYMIRLHSTFQDQSSLFFVMDIAENGEILSWLKRHGTFSVACTQFYLAELLCAIEFLHSIRIIHRDLKPENILLDRDMHIKLTDFGMSKILAEPSADDAATGEADRANSFVGTAEYVSPELLTDKAATTLSDIWAVGCILYQMLAGRPPFKASNEYQTFQKITKLNYTYPPFFPAVAENLVRRILVLDPRQRLGGGSGEQEVAEAKDECCKETGVKALMSHPFLAGVDWPAMRARECQPPPLESLVPKEQLARPTIDTGDGSAPLSPLSSPSSPTSPLSTELQAPVDDKWRSFLYDGEHILHTTAVWKKRGLFSAAKRRRLILTDRPRLMYVDEEQMVEKGEIPWSPALYVEVKSPTVFRIHTPGRTYHLEDREHDAQRWLDIIMAVKTRVS